MESIETENLAGIVAALNAVISKNKAYLSEVDGAIGDGDHGINMAKGFGLANEAVAANPGTVGENLTVLSNTLMMKIGGSMGPLYGMFFKAWAKELSERPSLDLEAVTAVVEASRSAIQRISPAKPGDKTLVDCLEPAVEALRAARAQGVSLEAGLTQMKAAAAAGRDSTKDMVAKLGRSSRLGERSRGVLDAGSCSCYLILETLADEIIAAARA